MYKLYESFSTELLGFELEVRGDLSYRFHVGLFGNDLSRSVSDKCFFFFVLVCNHSYFKYMYIPK